LRLSSFSLAYLCWWLDSSEEIAVDLSVGFSSLEVDESSLFFENLLPRVEC